MSTQPHAALNFAKSEIDKQLSTRGNDEYASADLLVIAVLLADPDWTDRLRSCPWLRIDPNDVAGDVEGRIWFFGAEDGAFGVATLNGRGEVLEQDSIKPAKGFGSDANAWFATSYQRFGGPALEFALAADRRPSRAHRMG